MDLDGAPAEGPLDLDLLSGRAEQGEQGLGERPMPRGVSPAQAQRTQLASLSRRRGQGGCDVRRGLQSYGPFSVPPPGGSARVM